jgi:hypothetical protein
MQRVHPPSKSLKTQSSIRFLHMLLVLSMVRTLPAILQPRIVMPPVTVRGTSLKTALLLVPSIYASPT